MKTTPTDIDREAARLFTVGRGMTYGRECAGAVGAVVWNVSHGQDVEADAIDTDDPATVGVMLAQVEMAYGARVDATWRWRLNGIAEYVVRIETSATVHAAHGPTRSTALVAAMRQLKR